MRVRNNGAAVYYSAVGGGSNEQSSEGVISLGKWHHMAMVREGTSTEPKLVARCNTVHVQLAEAASASKRCDVSEEMMEAEEKTECCS